MNTYTDRKENEFVSFFFPDSVIKRDLKVQIEIFQECKKYSKL
jgi:hypothetical protein